MHPDLWSGSRSGTAAPRCRCCSRRTQTTTPPCSPCRGAIPTRPGVRTGYPPGTPASRFRTSAPRIRGGAAAAVRRRGCRLSRRRANGSRCTTPAPAPGPARRVRARTPNPRSSSVYPQIDEKTGSSVMSVRLFNCENSAPPAAPSASPVAHPVSPPSHRTAYQIAIQPPLTQTAQTAAVARQPGKLEQARLLEQSSVEHASARHAGRVVPVASVMTARRRVVRAPRVVQW